MQIALISRYTTGTVQTLTAAMQRYILLHIYVRCVKNGVVTMGPRLQLQSLGDVCIVHM